MDLVLQTSPTFFLRGVMIAFLIFVNLYYLAIIMTESGAYAIRGSSFTSKLGLTKIKSSTMLSYIISFLNPITFFVLTSMSIPITQTALYFLNCSTMKEYYEIKEETCSKNVIDTTLALILLFQSFALIAMMSNLYVDPNPFNSSPISGRLRTSFIYSVILMYVLPLFYQTVGFREYCIWIALILILSREIHYLLTPPTHLHKIAFFRMILDSTVFWIILTSCVNTLFDTTNPDNYSAYYIVGGWPLWILFKYSISINRKTRVLNRDIFREENRYVINEYLAVFSKQISFIGDPEIDTLYERNLVLRSLKKYEFTSDDFSQILKNTEENFETRQAWLDLFSFILEVFRKRLGSKNSSILFLQAYLMLSVTDKKWATMAKIQELCSYSLGFQEHYALFRLKNQIEAKMKKEERKEDILLDDIIEYENLFTKFQRQIYTISQYKRRFWKEIKSAQPNIQILNKLSDYITILKGRVNLLYDSLYRLNDNNIKTLELFGAYLNEIENNVRRANKIYDKLMYAISDMKKKKNNIRGQSFKNSAIVVISGLYKERGKILSVNYEAIKLFGFTQSEIIGSDIENYMPQFYAKKHKDYITKFYKSGQSSRLGHRAKVFIINKENFLIEADIHVKMMSNLDKGISILGVIFCEELNDFEMPEQRKNKTKRFLLCYEDRTGQIYYSCENSYK